MSLPIARRLVLVTALATCFSSISPGQGPLRADDEAPWDIPDGDYYRELEALNTYEESSGGVRMRVSVVQNAFHYFISRGCRELRRAGYEGAALGRKLQSLYSKYKSQKGRVLFIVTISGAGGAKRAFYLQRAEKHLQIKTGAKKHTVSVIEQSHKPKARVYEVYQYVPNAPRKYAKKKLYPAANHRMLISCRTIKSDSKTPIQMTLSGMFHTAAVGGGGRNGNEGLGVNETQGQISMRRWRDQIMPNLDLPIAPTRWREVDPPDDLLRLCERLSGRK